MISRAFVRSRRAWPGTRPVRLMLAGAMACAATALVVAVSGGPAGRAAVARDVSANLPVSAEGTASSVQAFDGLLDVVCPSARSCTAIGYHNAGRQHVFALSKAGRWRSAATLRLPANGSRFGASFFDYFAPEPGFVNSYYHSLSCASPGNCAAVGGYVNNRGDFDGLLLTEANGRWARAIEEPLPANALTPHTRGEHQNNDPTAVSCASPGNCTAIGFYQSADRGAQGLLLSEVNGSWARGIEAPLPPFGGLDPVGGIQLESVSCASAGDCTAVGEYQDDSGQYPGVMLTETNGQWAQGVPASLPAGAWSADGQYQGVTLTSVSCAAAGDCAAVGWYHGYRGKRQTYGGLLFTEANGQWAQGIAAPLPSNRDSRQMTTTTELDLNSVSCPSPGNCTAVGDYLAHGHQEGLLLTETDGIWNPGVEAPLPRGTWSSGIGPAVTLKSVSCTSPGNCAAVGDYFGKNGLTLVPLLLSETRGRWATAVPGRLPTGAAASAFNLFAAPDSALAGLFSVSCASAGSCTAVGTYPHQKSGASWGLRFTEAHGIWGRGVWVKAP